MLAVQRRSFLTGVTAALAAGRAAWAARPSTQALLAPYLRVRRVSALGLSADGKRLLVQEGGKIRTFSVGASGATESWSATGSFRQVAWRPNSNRLLTAISADQRALVDLSQSGSTSIYAGERVQRYAVSPQGRLAIVSELSDGVARVAVQPLAIHLDQVEFSAFDLEVGRYSLTPAAPQRLRILTPNGMELLSSEGRFTNLAWSARGDRLTVGGTVPTPDAFASGSLRLIDGKTGREIAVWGDPADSGFGYGGGEWISSDRWVLRRIAKPQHPGSGNFPDYALFDADGVQRTPWEPIEWVTAGGSGPKVFESAHGEFIMHAIRRARCSLYAVAKGQFSEVREVAGITGTISSASRAASESDWALQIEDVGRPPEVYLTNKGGVRQLTQLNAPAGSTLVAEDVSWASGDGRAAHGLVIRHRETLSRPSPAIIYLHGGPVQVVSRKFGLGLESWGHPLEALAEAGFVVLAVQYRGSESFGVEVQRPNDHEGAIGDVVSGAEWLLARGLGRNGKLGLLGFSHGAWIGPLALQRFNQFGAASFASGIGNLFTLYDLMPDALNLANHDWNWGGSSYDGPLRYQALSPAFHFAGVTAPCLFESGGKTSAMTSVALPKAARRAKVPVEHVVYPAEEHTLGSPQALAYSAELNLDWFRYWVGDGLVSEPRARRWNSLRAR